MIKSDPDNQKSIYLSSSHIKYRVQGLYFWWENAYRPILLLKLKDTVELKIEPISIFILKYVRLEWNGTSSFYEENLMLKWIDSGKIARYVQKPVCSDILTCFSVINARVAI